ncbi:MAG: hypothetical protein NPMRth3_250005 [Nitrosopumilales archaeon]|nr:MAG: hypothetical protein NPMRth3_250005 [Nitrosopumilales archaeon]
MKFKYLPAKKLKVLMALFFGSGILGILIGTGLGIAQPIFMLTVMGVINLILGALVGWIFLTREPRESRKKRKK